MKTVKISIDPDNAASLPEGRVDFNRLDATSEWDIAAQQRMDETLPCWTSKAGRGTYPVPLGAQGGRQLRLFGRHRKYNIYNINSIL